MAKKATLILILSLLLLATPTLAGGWVVITLTELPADVRAGEPVTFDFLVQQHGVRPVDGLNVVVTAEQTAGGERLAWTARSGAEPGHYVVEATFPASGDWSWQVTAEPFPQVAPLPALHVLPALAPEAVAPDARAASILLRAAGISLLGIGALLAVVQRHRPGLFAGLGGAALLLLGLVTAPAPPAEVAAAPPAQEKAATGEALFLAKGCIACHRHDALSAGESLSIGPDLSSYQPDPEFVRAWLRNPAAIRPNTQMPNLQLSDGDIEALLAFLQRNPKAESAAAGREACPVTRPPQVAFQPPASQAADGSFWHGNSALWTTLPDSGTWDYLPHHEHGYTQKLPFWSEGYDWIEEEKPALALEGRQLDGDAIMAGAGASNAYHPDYGSMIMTGFVLPAAGCWEITATYEDASLSFVVWVEG